MTALKRPDQVARGDAAEKISEFSAGGPHLRNSRRNARTSGKDRVFGLAHTRFRVDGFSRRAIKDPKSAFPRFRRLWTNSKKARYRGRFSWETPRCGRSQLRNKDQAPSIVFTCTSWKPSPSSSRAYSPRLWQTVRCYRKPAIDVVFVGMDGGSRGNRRLENRLDRFLLNVC